MWMDVVDLNAFYRSRLGQVSRRIVMRRVRNIWPDVAGQVVVGIGYATPYLKQFRDEAERVLAIMPASQGVTHWPREGHNLACLSDEAELPLPDYSVDRLLLVHALENTDQLIPMMQEAWRVLKSSGRLMVVVPSRRGMWARTESTPFGHGKPFSKSQIERLMRESNFDPVGVRRCLYMPPVSWPVVLHSAVGLERLGQRWLTGFGGILIAEATKRVYAVAGRRQTVRRSSLKGVRATSPVPATGRSGSKRADIAD